MVPDGKLPDGEVAGPLRQAQQANADAVPGLGVEGLPELHEVSKPGQVHKLPRLRPHLFQRAALLRTASGILPRRGFAERRRKKP